MKCWNLFAVKPLLTVPVIETDELGVVESMEI